MAGRALLIVGALKPPQFILWTRVWLLAILWLYLVHNSSIRTVVSNRYFLQRKTIDTSLKLKCFLRTAGSPDNDVALKETENVKAVWAPFTELLQRAWFSPQSSDSVLRLRGDTVPLIPTCPWTWIQCKYCIILLFFFWIHVEKTVFKLPSFVEYLRTKVFFFLSL